MKGRGKRGEANPPFSPARAVEEREDEEGEQAGGNFFSAASRISALAVEDDDGVCLRFSDPGRGFITLYAVSFYAEQYMYTWVSYSFAN